MLNGVPGYSKTHGRCFSVTRRDDPVPVQSGVSGESWDATLHWHRSPYSVALATRFVADPDELKVRDSKRDGERKRGNSPAAMATRRAHLPCINHPTSGSKLCEQARQTHKVKIDRNEGAPRSSRCSITERVTKIRPISRFLRAKLVTVLWNWSRTVAERIRNCGNFSRLTTVNDIDLFAPMTCSALE